MVLPEGQLESDPDMIDTLPVSDTIQPDNVNTNETQDKVGITVQKYALGESPRLYS